jgi:hypothetical protein
LPHQRKKSVTLCFSAFVLLSLRNNRFAIIALNPRERGGDIMKKIAIQLFIIAMAVATYVMPVLADGNGW